jgi:hypothetical protein
LVEHVTENHGVGGSIPPLGTTLPSDHRESELRAWCAVSEIILFSPAGLQP